MFSFCSVVNSHGADSSSSPSRARMHGHTCHQRRVPTQPQPTPRFSFLLTACLTHDPDIPAESQKHTCEPKRGVKPRHGTYRTPTHTSPSPRTGVSPASSDPSNASNVIGTRHATRSTVPPTSQRPRGNGCCLAGVEDEGRSPVWGSRSRLSNARGRRRCVVEGGRVRDGPMGCRSRSGGPCTA